MLVEDTYQKIRPCKPTLGRAKRGRGVKVTLVTNEFHERTLSATLFAAMSFLSLQHVTIRILHYFSQKQIATNHFYAK